MQPYPYPIGGDPDHDPLLEIRLRNRVDQFIAEESSVMVDGRPMGIHDLLDLGYTVILTRDSVRIEKKC